MSFSCFTEVPFGTHYSLLYTITVMAIWKFSISCDYCSLSDAQTWWSSFLKAVIFAFCCICFLVGACDRPVLICFLVQDAGNYPLRSHVRILASSKWTVDLGCVEAFWEMLVNKTITQAFGHIVMGLEDAICPYPFKFILNFSDLTYIALSSLLFFYTK